MFTCLYISFCFKDSSLDKHLYKMLLWFSDRQFTWIICVMRSCVPAMIKVPLAVGKRIAKIGVQGNHAWCGRREQFAKPTKCVNINTHLFENVSGYPYSPFWLFTWTSVCRHVCILKEEEKKK